MPSGSRTGRRTTPPSSGSALPSTTHSISESTAPGRTSNTSPTRSAASSKPPGGSRSTTRSRARRHRHLHGRRSRRRGRPGRARRLERQHVDLTARVRAVGRLRPAVATARTCLRALLQHHRRDRPIPRRPPNAVRMSTPRQIAARAIAAAMRFVLRRSRVGLLVSPRPAALLTVTSSPARNGAGNRAEHAPHDVVVITDERYDAHPDALLDVYVPGPACERRPSAHRPVDPRWRLRRWIQGRTGRYMRMIADAGFTVVAVRYSLAPEERHPTPLRQVMATLAHVQADPDRLHVDATRFVLAGDSAGAHITAQLATIVTDPATRDRCHGDDRARAARCRCSAASTTCHGSTKRRRSRTCSKVCCGRTRATATHVTIIGSSLRRRSSTAPRTRSLRRSSPSETSIRSLPVRRAAPDPRRAAWIRTPFYPRITNRHSDTSTSSTSTSTRPATLTRSSPSCSTTHRHRDPRSRSPMRSAPKWDWGSGTFAGVVRSEIVPPS